MSFQFMVLNDATDNTQFCSWEWTCDCLVTRLLWSLWRMLTMNFNGEIGIQFSLRIFIFNMQFIVKDFFELQSNLVQAECWGVAIAHRQPCAKHFSSYIPQNEMTYVAALQTIFETLYFFVFPPVSKGNSQKFIGNFELWHNWF